MAENNRLELEQQIGLRLSQQQLRYVRLLEMTAPELDDAVERELEDNPALTPSDAQTDDTQASSIIESDTPRYIYSRPINYNYTDSEIPEFAPRDDSESLYDNLMKQLRESNLSDSEFLAAQYIIGNLDTDGYLRRSIENISDDIMIETGQEIDVTTMQKALQAVRALEPHGLAAFSLQESLILQLEAMPDSEAKNNALLIVKKMFEQLSMNHIHKIISALKKGQEAAMSAIELIRNLNPRPGYAIGGGISDNATPIIPDVILEKDNDRFILSLNNRHPDLAISESFEKEYKKLEKVPRKKRERGYEFIVSRRNDARDFIKILGQRQQTLMRVASAILTFQKRYFDTEDVAQMRPMMMKDIADITGDDLSVISRATNNKYISTPWGIFPLRYFFSDTLGSEGAEFTAREMEQTIKNLVDSEDPRHPLSDEAITQAMRAKGYDISRRTVAKYRDRMKIPVARLRKIF